MQLLEQLLRRVSDTTALRYISVLWGLFCTAQDLYESLATLTQVQLVDAIHVFQQSRNRHASVHSSNVLKALRWFASTVQPENFPSLHQGLFHAKSWQSQSVKREAIPLPLGFIYWLECCIVLGSFTPQEMLFAGALMLCVWGSLRFGDAQHLRLQDFYIDYDSIRGVAYRTKAKAFMPFGCITAGLTSMPGGRSWVLHWLHSFAKQVTLCRETGDFPDYIFLAFDSGEVRPMSYAEALVGLRGLLQRWGELEPQQCCQYTLHSMKVTLLAFYRHMGASLEIRHLQGHHSFAPSSTLYGRDDIAPILQAQVDFVKKVASGWRPRTPILRGVTYMPREPPVELGTVTLTDVECISSLPFFHWEVTSVQEETFSVVEGDAESAPLHESTAIEPSVVHSGGPPPVPEPVEGLQEEETSDSEVSIEQADEVAFLCAETSCILHACVDGKPACNSRGTFRFISHPESKARF